MTSRTAGLKLAQFIIPLSLSVAWPAHAKTISVTQANLVQSLSSAQPGDTLVLTAGGYGVITLPKKTWQTPITIDARRALMAGVVMRNVNGVNWLGGTIIGTMYGISVRDSSRIGVSEVDISIAQRGIVIDQSTDVTIRRNKLHHLRTDGIDVTGQRILIESNTITDMLPISGDHPDGVQIWSPPGLLTRDVTLKSNITTGNMQGIFARAPEMGIDNLIITGNKITVTYPNGIAMLDTRSGIATGNVVQSPKGAANNANMYSRGGSANKLCGNAVPDVPKAVANLPCAG